jgi:hypothetical protein
MLLAELVVVFLGVYGAFWVDNYREQLDRNERTQQVVLALQQDHQRLHPGHRRISRPHKQWTGRLGSGARSRRKATFIRI